MALSPVAFGIAAGFPRRIANDVAAARAADEAAARSYRPTMAELVARYGAPRGGAVASWYVRKSGSDSNGGSSASLTPDRSGTDMSVTNGSTQVTSATGAFVAGDVGKGINIATVLYRIATVTNSTTIQLERNYAGTTGSNKTWAIGGALLTIGKMLGTAAGIMQNGDTLYVGAGTYREIVNPTLTGITAETFVVGDVTGQFTGDPGDVIITPYLTNDKTASSGSVPLTVKSFFTYQNLVIVASTNGCVSGSAGISDVKLQNCVVNALRLATNVAACNFTGTAGAALNITIERSIIVCKPTTSSLGHGIRFTLPRSTADYNANCLVQNCLIMGPFYGVLSQSSGSGAGFGGGVTVRQSTIYSVSYGVIALDANLSTTYPTTVNYCIVISGLGLSASVSGQIVEDYNVLGADTPRNNVTAGTHSISDQSYAPLFELGAAYLMGRNPRPMFQPLSGSPVLGFHPAAGSAVDILNAPRPAGGGSANYAAGAYERANSAVQETVTVDSDTSAIRFDGPGYQDFDLAVDAVATTVTVRSRHDSTYAGTLPQLLVHRGRECGVADASTTGVAAADTWETLTLGPFTPTKSGIVTIRVLSNDTNGAGKAFFDTFTVS